MKEYGDLDIKNSIGSDEGRVFTMRSQVEDIKLKYYVLQEEVEEYKDLLEEVSSSDLSFEDMEEVVSRIRQLLITRAGTI